MPKDWKFFFNKNDKSFLILESTGRKCIITLNRLDFFVNILILNISLQQLLTLVIHYKNQNERIQHRDFSLNTDNRELGPPQNEPIY